MPSVAQPDMRSMANAILRSSLMDSTFKLTKIRADSPEYKQLGRRIRAQASPLKYSGETDTCPGCGCEKLVEDQSCGHSECRLTVDPVGARIAENTRRNVTDVLAEYPTGRKALAAADVWRRDLPIKAGYRALELRLRVIREAQRSCLAIVERWAPNQTEDFYLGLIRGIVSDDRPDRTTVEREVITHYREVKAQARARQGDGR